MSNPENMISKIRKDLAVLRLVIENDLPVTDSTIKGLWQWFPDVELVLPLPIMPLTDEQRKEVSINILNDMDEAFAHIEKNFSELVEADEKGIETKEETLVNNLWRELAGCYAETINAEVPQLPEEIKETLGRGMYETLVNGFGGDEDMLSYKLQNDSTLRMMIRMAGLDPDLLIHYGNY